MESSRWLAGDRVWGSRGGGSFCEENLLNAVWACLLPKEENAELLVPGS